MTGVTIRVLDGEGGGGSDNADVEYAVGVLDSGQEIVDRGQDGQVVSGQAQFGGLWVEMDVREMLAQGVPEGLGWDVQSLGNGDEQAVSGRRVGLG